MTGLDPATARPPLTSGAWGGSWPQQSGPCRSHMSPAAHVYLAHPLGPGFSCPSDKKSSSVENSRRIFLSLSLSLFFPLSMHLSSKQIPEIKNVIVVMVSACCKYETDARVESWAASPSLLSSVVWKVPAGAPLSLQRHSPPHPQTRASQGRCERWDAWRLLGSGRRETQGDGGEALDGFSPSHLVPVVFSIEGTAALGGRGLSGSMFKA